MYGPYVKYQQENLLKFVDGERLRINTHLQQKTDLNSRDLKSSQPLTHDRGSQILPKSPISAQHLGVSFHILMNTLIHYQLFLFIQFQVQLLTRQNVVCMVALFSALCVFAQQLQFFDSAFILKNIFGSAILVVARDINIFKFPGHSRPFQALITPAVTKIRQQRI